MDKAKQTHSKRERERVCQRSQLASDLMQYVCLFCMFFATLASRISVFLFAMVPVVI